MGFFDIFNNSKKEAIAKVEFPSHKRILEDSIKLIQTTKKLDILLSRYDLAEEHYRWIQMQIKNGVPIYFKSNGDFQEELRELANFHIVRIAKEYSNTHLKKMNTLKTEKAKNNQQLKFQEQMNIFKNSLKSSSKLFKWRDNIDTISRK